MLLSAFLCVIHVGSSLSLVLYLLSVLLLQTALHLILVMEWQDINYLQMFCLQGRATSSLYISSGGGAQKKFLLVGQASPELKRWCRELLAFSASGRKGPKQKAKNLELCDELSERYRLDFSFNQIRVISETGLYSNYVSEEHVIYMPKFPGSSPDIC